MLNTFLYIFAIVHNLKFEAMKRTFLISLLVVATGVMAFIGCEKPEKEDPQYAQAVQAMQQNDGQEQTGIIKSVQFDYDLSNSLDEIFCEWNPIVENIMHGDSLLRIINNIQELNDVGGEGISDLIDFDRYCIIWGRVIAPHSGCNIDSCQLECNGSEYTFSVNVNIGSEGYQAITPLYFWRVYPKIKENLPINFIINFIQESLSIVTAKSMRYMNAERDSLYIVNNQTEYESIFGDYVFEEFPSIDFSNYTLLFAQGSTPNLIGERNENLTFEDNVYTWNINIVVGDATQPDYWGYAALINRKGLSTSNVIFNLNIE